MTINSASPVTSIGVGTCYHPSHCPKCPISMTGMIITGSNKILIGSNYLQSGYITSIVLGFCGHVGIIVTGSTGVTTEQYGKARIGSLFTGYFTGIIITGEPLVSVGDSS